MLQLPNNNVNNEDEDMLQPLDMPNNNLGQSQNSQNIQSHEGIYEEEEVDGGIVNSQPSQALSNGIHNTSNGMALNKMQSMDIDEPNENIQSLPIEGNTQMTIDDVPIYANISRMHEWTVDDVCNWLKTRFKYFGNNYVDLFRKNNINGSKLKTMDTQLLFNMGITHNLHRCRIERDIVDSNRPIEQMQHILSPSMQDGGTISSKFLRFNTNDVYNWCNKLVSYGLNNYSTILLNQNVNGYMLFNATTQQEFYQYLGNNSNISPELINMFIQIIWNIKANHLESIECQAVEQAWIERMNPNDIGYKLLPQHLIDYVLKFHELQQRQQQEAQAQAAQAQQSQHMQTQLQGQSSNSQYSQGQQGYYQNVQQGSNQAIGQKRTRPLDDEDANNTDNNDENDGPGTSVLTWTTQDCINWLNNFGYKQKYERNFEQLKIDGQTLIQLTQNTLENICCIHVKAHAKQLFHGIDKLRDSIINSTFAKLPHVQSFRQEQPVRPSRRKVNATSNINTSSNNINTKSTKRIKTNTPTTPLQNGPLSSQPSQYSTTPITGPSQQPQQQQQQQQQQQPPQPQPQQQQYTQIQQPYNIQQGLQLQYGYGVVQPSNIGIQQQPMGYNIIQSQPGIPQQPILPPQQHPKTEAACLVCGRSDNIMRCSNCKNAFYCSRDHQMQDWPNHSRHCMIQQ